jgi:hypothetical protein
MASKLFFLSLVLAVSAFVTAAQTPKVQTTAASAPSSSNYPAEALLAVATVEAHGGSRFKAMKTLVVSGSVDVTTSAIAQAIPATFTTVFAGDKYRIEIMNPIQPLKQVYDGTETTSTIRGGFTLPPINRLGLPLLPRLGETGFILTPLPEAKKKKKGFRVTSPEGYYTDFYIDEKSGLVKGYDSSYTINGRTVTTSVEVDKYRIVNGIHLPERYVQRFDMERLTVYANFKAKEILVDTPLAPDVFTMAGN